MKQKVYTYEGENLTVSYDVKRCIHAKECVHGQPQVFDPNKRPWVDPDKAQANVLAATIIACPTGALHFTRTDGGTEEPTPDENTIRVTADGPLYVRGDVEINEPDGTVALKDTRVALCRCGLSKNKPLCDNSHLEGFQADDTLGRMKPKPLEEPGPLSVTPAKDGPLLVAGPMTLVGGGEEKTGVKVALCRCGGSQNKPFCDGTHKKIGFTTEA